MHGNDLFQLLPAAAEKNRDGVCQRSQGQLVKELKTKAGFLDTPLRTQHILTTHTHTQSSAPLGPH